MSASAQYGYAPDPLMSGLADVLDRPSGIFADFRRNLERDSHAIAVLDDRGYKLSNSELDQLSLEIATEMRTEGLVPGDVVIICLPNWTEWMAVYLAALRNKLIPGTLPVTSDPGSISHTVKLVGARAVFLPAQYRSRDFSHELGELATGLNQQLSVLLLHGDQSTRNWRRIDGTEPRRPAYPQGLEHILFSSSTTGKSKAIAHSESSLRAYNNMIIDRYEIGNDQGIFMPSPLGHSTGFWHGARLSIIVGATLVLQDRWNAQRALELVAETDCSVTVAATPFLADLVDAEWDSTQSKFQGLRYFLCGGAPIPPSLIERARTELPDTQLCSIWAMSEGGATSSLPDDALNHIAKTCGVPMPGLDLRILTPEGWAGPGIEGEIVMKTPSLFLGYLNQDDLYRNSFLPEGYFRTGDLGILDGDGYLRITGRLKDLIIRGGVNISPVEIENALSSHPRIARVAVVGEPEERMGERICAVIQPVGDDAVTLDELTSWLSVHGTPRRLWPESVRIVGSMPETPAGKIRKNVLVDQLFARS